MAASSVVDPVLGTVVDRFLDEASEDTCSNPHLEGYFPRVPPTSEEQSGAGDKMENGSSKSPIPSKINYEELRQAKIAPKDPDEEGRLRELYFHRAI